MLISHILSDAWNGSGMLQKQLKQDLLDSDLDVESNEAYTELQRRSGTINRFTVFFDTVKRAVAKIHNDTRSSMERESPDSVFGNVVTTVTDDLLFRTFRRTIRVLLSQPGK